MKNKIFYILIIILFSFASKVFANELCSQRGYSIFTINGIFTDEDGAVINKNNLKRSFSPAYNNQPLTVDFLYNPTHLGGVGDLIDVVAQGLFDQRSDYDLTEMLNDASQKVTTQKLLLVAHSQGNFYSNNFYDKVASQIGGVPSQSLGVYSVASPANRVAGGGKYLTSDTDSVIIATASRYFQVLPANVHITLKETDGNGHSFSDVYLKYQGDRIISDIKLSLSKLKENNEQKIEEPCISPPELTAFHKIQKVAFTGADFLIDKTKDGAIYLANGIYDISLAVGNVFNGLFATTIESLPDTHTGEIPLQVQTNKITKEIPPYVPSISSPKEVLNKITPLEEPILEHIKQENILPPVIAIIPEITNVVLHGNGASSRPAVVEVEENLPEEEILSPIIPPVTPPEEPSITPPEEIPVIPPIIPDPVIEPVIDITPPVITLKGNTLEVVIKNSSYLDAGATAVDDIDGEVDLVIEGVDEINTSMLGNYPITYTATDIAGNISTKTRTVKVSSYQYIAKNSFGKNNGDGNNWQVWAFNGSSIYDWVDTYVDNYLREQFKVKTYHGGVYCSACLQIGVFKNNPENGFEEIDFSVYALEGNPQNNMDDSEYTVIIQWDSTGYTYTVLQKEEIISTGHVNIKNLNDNSWTGWDNSSNSFQTFPSGDWRGIIDPSLVNRTGGSNMILKPLPIYKNKPEFTGPTLSVSNEGEYAGTGVNPIRGRANLTPFSFQVIYTDIENNTPQNVKLNVFDSATATSISEIEMQKISLGADELTDGNFANGELYFVNNILYDTGEYDYYFTANDSEGNLIRTAENNLFNFGTISSTYTYIPKYSFGADNGDGNNWRTWYFNGSEIYDWGDTYVGGYLLEQFKIGTSKSSWCSQCLQRGIFNHDPQKGFEKSNLAVSSLENNPQNNMDQKIYDVAIQWDSIGYGYVVSLEGETISSGHTDVKNVNENIWVGWDTSNNGFETFPSGVWYGDDSPREGGSGMILQPYPVYKSIPE